MSKQFYRPGEFGDPMSEPGKPKQAATVILLRPAEVRGFEVFLTRRTDAMPFLGGMYCYPGGTVSKQDCRAAAIARTVGRTPKQARQIIGAAFAPEEAIGLWIAAVREVFEEVGVLLAAEPSGAKLSTTPERAARLAERHGELSNQTLSFTALLEGEQLYCDLGSLSHFSYWQTPARFALRFDTRFFLAALPPGQTPLATSYEVAHSVWLTPDRALKLCKRGELPMIFPTFASLRTLADFDTLESVLREFGLGK
ncbi:MAG: NUDIX hydrolase [Candidatus Binatia bacterium]